MMEHTFQKGDRVFGQTCRSCTKTPGTFEKFDKDVKACIIRRDDGKSGIEPGLYWYAAHLTTHDRDFHVGDWVRYECVKPMPLSHLLRDGMQGNVVECLEETVSVQFSEHGGLFVLKSNLVKITPPTEEKVEKADTVTIEHDQWGRVEGVKRENWFGGSIRWVKEEKGRHVHFHSHECWREVRPKRWVAYSRQELKDNEVRRFLSVWFEGEMDARKFDLPQGYRWKTVEIEREVEG